MRVGAGLALECDLLCGHGRSGTLLHDLKSTAGAEQFARLGEVLGRIDAERYAVDEGHVDAHAGLERAQLLELFALLERGGGKADEASERGAAVGIKPDVMIERPFA